MSLEKRVRLLTRFGSEDIHRRLAFAPVHECLRVRHAMTKRRSGSRARFVIHPRELDGHPIEVRVGTADAAVVWDTFVGRYHLVPPDLDGQINRIWDLGSNIGLTVAHYAATYPEVVVSGIELDPVIAEIARKHIEPWRMRAEIRTGAVWRDDGAVTFASERGSEHATHVGEGDRRSASFSLNTLMAADDVVDFVKMDVEGAEAELLSTNTNWASKVRCLKVEVHGTYTRKMCMSDLRALDFDTRVADDHWAAVIAFR